VKSLERSLGLFAVVAISVGAMLGGEIFVLPAVAAQLTGPSLWLAYLVAALLVMPAALSKAELATAMPDSGGAYLYIERAMGPLSGTVAGIGLWLSLLLKSTFALAVLGSYLSLVVDVSTTIVGLCLLVFVSVLNVVGVRRVSAIQKYIVGGCLIVLTALLVIGRVKLPSASAGIEFMSGGITGFAAAIGLVFISYAGVTKIAAIAEEVRDVSRTIPLGMLISLLTIAALYTGLGWVLARAYTPDALAGSETPIATLALDAVGPWGSTVIAVTAVFALLGMTNAGLLAASRFPFAMARGQLAPPSLAKIDRRFVTPIPAIVLSAATMAVFLLTLDVVKIAKLASAFMIAAFMAVNLSVIIFRESRAKWYSPTFRAPLYPFLQGFGILAGGAILISLGTFPLLGIAIGVGVGSALYFGYGRRRVDRLGVLRQMTTRDDLLDDTRTQGVVVGGHSSQTTVALLGTEGSSEALVHLGLSLTPGEDLSVLHLEEVPEQTDLNALARGTDDRVDSIERRLVHLGEEHDVGVHFDVVYTRDLRGTLYDHAALEHAQWVVMGWRDRSQRGIIVRDPLQWLTTHLPCNVALYRDAGIRTIRRIMAHAEPGPHDALVATTADSLAKLHGAEVTFINVVPTDVSDERLIELKEYHHQLGRLCKRPTKSEILRDDGDPTDALVRATARYDLALTGAQTRPSLRSILHATPEEKLTEAAHCAVLQLLAPEKAAHGSIVAADDGSIVELPEPVAVATGSQAKTKEQLFAELARLFDGASPRIVADKLEPLMWERERTQSTAVGHGVAIPHATVPGLLRTKLAVVVLEEPIDYDGRGTGVDVVLSLVGPPGDRQTHLRLLSLIAQRLIETSLLADLRAAKTPGDVRLAVTQSTPRAS
jgi:amino acid transporter/mannitol/fructose-specific phosphotransferase system IIA component (Ntr-type)